MKRVIRITESHLIHLIENDILNGKNAIDEQKETYTVPSDTLVKLVGSDIQIGPKEGKKYRYSLFLPILGKTEITNANLSLSSQVLNIEFSVTYGAGNQVENRLKGEEKNLKYSGITYKKIETGAFSKDKFSINIDLTKNKKVSQGIIDARIGKQSINITDDVILKIAS